MLIFLPRMQNQFQVMERGGVTGRKAIAWAGCGFEFAIVLGGIILGRYVDRTKEYKKVTLYCIALSLIFILPLGLTEHYVGKEPVLLIISLFFLGWCERRTFANIILWRYQVCHAIVHIIFWMVWWLQTSVAMISDCPRYAKPG